MGPILKRPGPVTRHPRPGKVVGGPTGDLIAAISGSGNSFVYSVATTGEVAGPLSASELGERFPLMNK